MKVTFTRLLLALQDKQAHIITDPPPHFTVGMMCSPTQFKSPLTKTKDSNKQLTNCTSTFAMVEQRALSLCASQKPSWHVNNISRLLWRQVFCVCVWINTPICDSFQHYHYSHWMCRQVCKHVLNFWTTAVWTYICLRQKDMFVFSILQCMAKRNAPLSYTTGELKVS